MHYVTHCVVHCIMHYVTHYVTHYVMHYVTQCVVHYVMHCVMHHVMRYVMHYVMHHVMHYVTHYVMHYVMHVADGHHQDEEPPELRRGPGERPQREGDCGVLEHAEAAEERESPAVAREDRGAQAAAERDHRQQRDQHGLGVACECGVRALQVGVECGHPLAAAARTVEPLPRGKKRRDQEAARFQPAGTTFMIALNARMSLSLMMPTQATAAPMAYCTNRLAMTLKLVSSSGAKLVLAIVRRLRRGCCLPRARTPGPRGNLKLRGKPRAGGD